MSTEDGSLIGRIAARVVTGPLAFLLAGLIDLGIFTAIAVRRGLAARLAAQRSC
jgi:hypothetical protein